MKTFNVRIHHGTYSYNSVQRAACAGNAERNAWRQALKMARLGATNAYMVTRDGRDDVTIYSGEVHH